MLKYIYDGQPFKHWCQENDYDYVAAFKVLKTYRQNHSVEESLNLTVKYLQEKYVHRNVYFYDAMPLRDYCQLHNINYFTIQSRIRKLLKTNPTSSTSEIVEIALHGECDNKTRYFYNGVSLKKYCDDHNLQYNRIYRKLKSLTNKEEITAAIEAFITSEKHPPKIPRYKINGLSLKQYCLQNGYNYSTMKDYLHRFQQKYPQLSTTDILNETIMYYIKNHQSKEKYFYQDKRLVDYCKENNLDYKIIFYYLSKNKYLSPHITEEQFQEVLAKYQLYQRKKIFKELRQTTDDFNISNYLETLSIDKASFRLISKTLPSAKDALLFCWYFGTNDQGKLYLTSESINKLFLQFSDLTSLNLQELIALYQCHIYDTRTYIINKNKRLIAFLVNKVSNEFSLRIKDYSEDLTATANYLMLEFIENNSSNYLGQTITYMTKYIYGSLKHYVLDNLKNKKYLTASFVLNNAYYPEHFDSEYISPEILTVITSLDPLSQQFIIYRYQKQLTLEEISTKLNLTITTVEEIEKKLLKQLHQNEVLKMKVKLKNL